MNDILLDADMVRPGPHWTDELNQAMKNSDAVVCATSNSWAGGPECIADFRTAEHLNNRVLCARPESSPADETGKAWQRTDLFGNGEPAETSLDDDGSLQNPSGTSGRLPQSKNTIKNKSTDMNDDDFWDDLLGQDQVLVPVVGPDLTVVKVGDAEQTLTTFIGQGLAEKFHSAKRHRHDHIHIPFAHLDTSFFLFGSAGGSTKQIEIVLSQGADFEIELTSGG